MKVAAMIPRYFHCVSMSAACFHCFDWEIPRGRNYILWLAHTVINQNLLALTDDKKISHLNYPVPASYITAVAKFKKANCRPCWHSRQFVTRCSGKMEKSAGAVWAAGQWLCWSDQTENTECVSESSLPFCHRGDRPRWGKRLIED